MNVQRLPVLAIVERDGGVLSEHTYGEVDEHGPLSRLDAVAYNAQRDEIVIPSGS